LPGDTKVEMEIDSIYSSLDLGDVNEGGEEGGRKGRISGNDIVSVVHAPSPFFASMKGVTTTVSSNICCN
jgi:hypothetical protein